MSEQNGLNGLINNPEDNHDGTRSDYEEKLSAELESISGAIQTVPSMSAMESDAQLTEEDIFRMKRLSMSKSMGTSELQSVASVVDSASNFDEHIPDTGDNVSIGSEEDLKTDVTQSYVDDNEREYITPSLDNKFGFTRARKSEFTLPNTVRELSYPWEPPAIPDTYTSSDYTPKFKTSKLYVVGTAHFSKSSQDDVRQTLAILKPDHVMLELCHARLSILELNEQALLEEAKKLTTQRVWQMIQEQGFSQGILNALLLATSAHITRQLNMAPGGEFRAAYEALQEIPFCRLTLGDRPINVTLQRALASLGFFQKIRLFFHLIFSKNASITVEDVERCKEHDLLEEILREMAGEFPQLSEIFVRERDEYMVHILHKLMERYTDQKIQAARDCGAPYQPFIMVAVVGIGHVPGIVANWERQINIAPLMMLPPPSKTAKIVRGTIKLGIWFGAAYGVYRLGRFTYSKIM